MNYYIHFIKSQKPDPNCTDNDRSPNFLLVPLREYELAEQLYGILIRVTCEIVVKRDK